MPETIGSPCGVPMALPRILGDVGPTLRVAQDVQIAWPIEGRAPSDSQRFPTSVSRLYFWDVVGPGLA